MVSSKQSSRLLYQVASAQQGYFTTRQAKLAGYQDSVHGYHVRNGDWERTYRGIYRIVYYPPAAWPDLVIWWLWSRGRDDRPQGVYTHDTALQIHGLMDRQPGPLHMTVPPGFRKGSELPSGVRLYKAHIPPEKVIRGDGFAYAILDGVAEPVPETPRPQPGPRPVADVSAQSPAAPAAREPVREPPPATKRKRADDWAVWS